MHHLSVNYVIYRWCLCALKNITYPLKHPSPVAETVLKCAVLPIIIQFVTVGGKQSSLTNDTSQTTEDFNNE